MPSINLITVHNPSDYWRCGHVTLPWQPLYLQCHISSEELVLRDLRYRLDNALMFQVDDIDPGNESRKTLSFSLNRAIPPGADDYSTASTFLKAERGNLSSQGIGKLKLEVKYGNDIARGVTLANERLTVWLNFAPAPENDQRNWYAGSATSVQLDHKEILDPFKAEGGEWMGQDTEKRCMQIDLLELPNLDKPICLFNKPWYLVSQFNGSIRAGVTIASSPFDYDGLSCQLYRVISLYTDVDYLVEELFIKGHSQGKRGANPVSQELDQPFVVRYFAHMDMSKNPTIQRFFVPDWFAIGFSQDYFGYRFSAGYGFATDVHADSVISHFVDEYLPDPPDRYKRFSWKLLPGKSAKCLHLFMRYQGSEFDSRIGKYWYEHIYKPLKAEVYQETL